MKTITEDRLRWLAGELEGWQRAGLIDAETSRLIAESYQVAPARSLNLARLMLSVGGTFVGIGVLWLIAANIDQVPPLGRLALVFALYAGAVVGAESLARRRAHQGSIPSPVVAAARLIATLLLGGVIFQAAQSLQVPAFEPRLLGLWAAGAALYAYLTRARVALLIAMAVGLQWVGAELVRHEPSALAVVLTCFGVALFGTAVAALHEDNEFAALWRGLGASALLVGLFASAIPMLNADDVTWSWAVVGVLAAGALAAGTAVVRDRRALLPTATVLAFSALGVALIFWEAGNDPERVGALGWAHAALAVSVYVAAALWIGALAARHDSALLTAIATVALVVFTTFQSFAVFAQIIQGAWLFVVLGLILLGTGYGFDRARRRLTATLEGVDR